MARARCASLVVLGLVLLAGCTRQTSTRAPELSQKMADCGPVAVIAFENSAANSQAGLILAELFQNELRATQHFTLVPAEVVAAKLASVEGKTMPTADLAKLLGAKSVVVGRVTEYTYKTGISEDPAVGVSVRLVDGVTGEVLWSGARSGTGDISWFKQDGLARLAQDVCRHLARSMAGIDGDGPH